MSPFKTEVTIASELRLNWCNGFIFQPNSDTKLSHVQCPMSFSLQIQFFEDFQEALKSNNQLCEIVKRVGLSNFSLLDYTKVWVPT